MSDAMKAARARRKAWISGQTEVAGTVPERADYSGDAEWFDALCQVMPLGNALQRVELLMQSRVSESALARMDERRAARANRRALAWRGGI